MKLKYIFLIAGLLIAATSVLAAPGDLDRTFNGTGIKFTNFATPNSITAPNNILAVQPDGKIIAGLTTNCPGVGSCVSLFRFNPNGSADITFGTAGRANLSYSVYGMWEIYDIALQPDGKILATGLALNAGQTKYVGALARFNVNGSLDQAFGGSGVVKNELAYDVYSTSVAAQPDGKILSGGYVVYGSPQAGFRYAWGVARNNADGSLDTGFNQSGMLIVDPANNGTSTLEGILAQPDGKIILAGECGSAIFGNTRDLTMMRYDPSGVRDTSFGNGGIASTNVHPATEFLKDAVLAARWQDTSGRHSRHEQRSAFGAV